MPTPEERQCYKVVDACYLCELVALTMTGRHVLRASDAQALREEELKMSHSLPCVKKEPLSATPIVFPCCIQLESGRSVLQRLDSLATDAVCNAMGRDRVTTAQGEEEGTIAAITAISTDEQPQFSSTLKPSNN